jgi:murein endopeptidase
MSLLAVLVATATLAAPPLSETPPLVPRLVMAPAASVQKLWERIKDLGTLKAQLAAIRERRALAHSCEGLVNLKALAATGGPLAGIGFRDHYRDRSWARPTLAHVLAVARERLRKELPGRDVTVGDVAQPGCGQIAHGVVVRVLEGMMADAWLAAARPYRGVMAVERLTRAGEFASEAHRFGDPDARIRVVSVALGALRERGAPTRLRLAETRYREGVDGESSWSLPETFRQLVRRGNLVSQGRATQGGEEVGLWHFADSARGLQLEAVTDASPRAKRAPALPALSGAREVRVARLQEKKPGSLPGEVVWLRRGEGWETWTQVPEAGHISHLGGLDADISYLTHENARHFAVDLGAMDVRATWRWFELLVEVAAALGAPVESILVDASILAHLRANLPMKGRGALANHPLWRLLSASPGHDGHHHVRLASPSARTEALAREALASR